MQSMAAFAEISGMQMKNSGVHGNMIVICDDPPPLTIQAPVTQLACKLVCVHFQGLVYCMRMPLHTRPQLLRLWRHLVVNLYTTAHFPILAYCCAISGFFHLFFYSHVRTFDSELLATLCYVCFWVINIVGNILNSFYSDLTILQVQQNDRLHLFSF